MKPSNKILKILAKRKIASTALIGVGGILSAKDIYEKIKIGASAVQIYTGFVIMALGILKRMEIELTNTSIT